MSNLTKQQLDKYRNHGASELVDAYEQLQQRNDELESELRSHKQCIEGVQQERDELAATVERLRIACQLGIDMFVANEINVPNTIETMQDAIEATPQANLNQIKREVIIKYANRLPDTQRPVSISSVKNGAVSYANTKYPSVKDGE